jgi:glycosyltransferase involved in cell wall biosynthesis
MVKKKKIFFVISGLNYGGAETTFLKIIQSIDKNKFKPYLITLKKPQHETWQKEYFLLSSYGIVVKTYCLPYAFLALIPLIFSIIIHCPQVIFSTLIFSNFLAIFANLLLFKPAINIVREDTIRSLDIKAGNSFRWMARFNYQQAHAILTLSNASKKDIVDNFNISEKKIRVVYNYFTFHYEEDESFHQKFRKAFPGEKNVVCVGRFSKEKNQMFLIKAIHCLVQTNQEWHLILIGIGDEYYLDCLEYVKHGKLEKNVSFLGIQSDAIKYIANADVLVCPSIYEGFGRVMIEALSVQTPVLAKKNPGSYEVLCAGKYGLLSDTEDETIFAQDIEKSLSFSLPSDTNVWLDQFREENVKHFYDDIFEKV